MWYKIEPIACPATEWETRWGLRVLSDDGTADDDFQADPTTKAPLHFRSVIEAVHWVRRFEGDGVVLPPRDT